MRAGGRIICETDNGTVPVSKKKLKDDGYHSEQVLSQVFGGDSSLSEKFTVAKTALYGRARITLLEVAL